MKKILGFFGKVVLFAYEWRLLIVLLPIGVLISFVYGCATGLIITSTLPKLAVLTLIVVTNVIGYLSFMSLYLSTVLTKREKVSKKDCVIPLLVYAPFVCLTVFFYTNPLSQYGMSPQEISLPRSEVWKWRSMDGNARVVSLFAKKDEFEWRPATEEELYTYKEEFPRYIGEFIYAGAGLIYGEDPKCGQAIPYLTGYAQVGFGFFPALTPLYELHDPLHLVIKTNVPIKGRLEYYLGQPETIGGFEIPRLREKPD